MDATTEKLRDRLRKAAGNHRDETQVLVQVGDLLAALRALEDVGELESELQDMVTPKEHANEISDLEEVISERDTEIDKLKDEIADREAEISGLRRNLADAMLAA